jgi:hypothetical protein
MRNKEQGTRNEERGRTGDGLSVFFFCSLMAQVWAAKRKGLIAANETFYPGHKKVQEEITPKILEIFGLAVEEANKLEAGKKKTEPIPEISLVSVFGEFFGGGYPHESVTPYEGVELVQTGKEGRREKEEGRKERGEKKGEG